jgi:hypothetical protein
VVETRSPIPSLSEQARTSRRELEQCVGRSIDFTTFHRVAHADARIADRTIRFRGPESTQCLTMFDALANPVAFHPMRLRVGTGLLNRRGSGGASRNSTHLLKSLRELPSACDFASLGQVSTPKVPYARTVYFHIIVEGLGPRSLISPHQTGRLDEKYVTREEAHFGG